MKTIYNILLAIAAAALPHAAHAQVAYSEPATSVMASGMWVKVRVEADGMYALSHDRLRQLGFENPERVQVYGYQPTLLLTFNDSKIPADLAQMQSLHSARKLMFYARGNADVAAEFWADNYVNNNCHVVHSFSHGGTYFLSDADAAPRTIDTLAAPEVDEADALSPVTTHTALIYNEKDVQNLSHGGSWFCDETVHGSTAPYDIKVRKAAGDRMGKLAWSTLFTAGGGTNYLVPMLDNGVTTEEYARAQASITDSHQEFARAMRVYNVQFPAEAEAGEFDFTLTFNVNPSAARSSQFALDYFALLYNRKNDLAGEDYMQMYFSGGALTSFTGIDNADEWTVWDVTDPLAVVNYALAAWGDAYIAQLKNHANLPTEVVAFRSDAELPEPEIVGTVANQNLHAMETPDMVILTSAAVMDAAEVAAEYNRANGLAVEIVDQQQIFNEYGSGNTSPESVRRFMRHLNSKNPGKIQALLIVGPTTYNMPNLISEDNAYVVTSEVNDTDYVYSPYSTRNFFCDAYFGVLGNGDAATDLWVSRTRYLKLFCSGVNIPVGRLPFKSVVDVQQYYRKVDEYKGKAHSMPMAGNLILSSDFAKAEEDQHMANAEALAKKIGDKNGTVVTVTRCASNLYSAKNNTTNRRVMMDALKRGALMFAYFGHGGMSQIGGSTSITDYLIHINTASDLRHKGAYPLVYLGSCNTGAIDKYETTLSSSLLLSEEGGGIAVISSGREVYQAGNQDLGEALSYRLYNSKPGSTLAALWIQALNDVLAVRNVSRDMVCNYLSYGYIGDPMVPIFPPTGSVELSVADNQIKAGMTNRVEGVVRDADGNVDQTFNGNVLITIYESPRTLTNVSTTSAKPHSSYIASVTEDHEVLAEYSAKVENGVFALDFTGPYSAASGTHRIHAYAYSTDGETRSMGHVAGVELIDEALEMPEYADATPLSISSFMVGNGLADEMLKGSIEFCARISAPAGIAEVSGLKNPVRLQIDDATTPLSRSDIKAVGEGEYELSYSMRLPIGGRHDATLSVMDAAGNWAESTVQFFIDTAPDARISASVEGQEVTFEVATALTGILSRTLIIERLNGDLVQRVNVESFPHRLTLPAGAYRAYVQQESDNSFAATDKLEIIIE